MVLRFPRHSGRITLFIGCAIGIAASSTYGDYTVERVLDGLNQPIYLTQAPGDTDALFIVERTDGGGQLGRIRRYDTTTGTLSTFLDVSGTILGDGGLFSITFHPEYESNGTFFVTMTQGTTNILDEYQMVGGGPQHSRRILEYPALNNVWHNVNQVLFDPFGDSNQMYVTTGDGGTQANEGSFNPTLIRDPDSIYGKIMRVDLAADFSTPANATTHAGIDVVALGLRNPYRSSFDRQTGDFYMGDVGFLAAEEVNFIHADQFADSSAWPLDFGWPAREGTRETIPAPPGGPQPPDAIEPIFDYPHGGVVLPHPPAFSGNAVIGGYVYRGTAQELQGRYFLADFINGNVYSGVFDRETDPADFNGTNLTDIQNHTVAFENLIGGEANIQYVSSFGEDLAGNLYILKFGNSFNPALGLGEIFRIVPTIDFTLAVDRETGELILTNETGANAEILGYTLRSPAGGLHTDLFTPIAGRLDDSQDGDGTIDPDNEWHVTSTAGDKYEFSEAPIGGPAVLAPGASFALSPNGGWTQSIYEDLTLDVTLAGGTARALVEFLENDGEPFPRSDLNFNGSLDPQDWQIFRQNHLATLAGLTRAETYRFGDLDGDLDNDFGDFRLFQSDYIAAHGEAAFAALLRVPEPGSGALTLACAALVLRSRRSRTRGAHPCRNS